MILRLLLFPIVLLWLAIIAFSFGVVWLIDGTYDHDANVRALGGHTGWMNLPKFFPARNK